MKFLCVSVCQKEARDPRFDDISGEFREEIFNRDYSFISDLKANEKQVTFLLKTEYTASLLKSTHDFSFLTCMHNKFNVSVNI